MSNFMFGESYRLRNSDTDIKSPILAVPEPSELRNFFLENCVDLKSGILAKNDDIVEKVLKGICVELKNLGRTDEEIIETRKQIKENYIPRLKQRFGSTKQYLKKAGKLEYFSSDCIWKIIKSK